MIEVRLEPHDVSWAARYLAEAERIRAAMPTSIDIEHIGSTSVPGLAAKPVIDILVGCPDAEVHDDVVKTLQFRLDYRCDGERRSHTWLSWPKVGAARYVVHGACRDTDVWKARIGFRDALRDSTELRAEYERLKGVLAEAHPDDVDAYTSGKRGFVERVLASRGIRSEWHAGRDPGRNA